MIEFNLLPDVKLAYVKTRRLKRLVTSVAVLVVGVVLTILIFLILFVDVAQKKNLRDINGDISTTRTQLQNIPNLDKILTIQNQLQSLPALHDQKPVASRIFSYMSELTPAKATISSVNVDFIKHTLIIGGDADTLSTVNQYTDTLKFTTYSVKGSKAAPKAFSNVVLTSFGRSSSGTTYTITTAFEPTIFKETDPVTLSVPKITSTRSITEQPTDLFKEPAPKPTNQ